MTLMLLPAPMPEHVSFPYFSLLNHAPFRFRFALFLHAHAQYISICAIGCSFFKCNMAFICKQLTKKRYFLFYFIEIQQKNAQTRTIGCALFYANFIMNMPGHLLPPAFFLFSASAYQSSE